jgi:DNA replication and repair protein RecF
MHITRLNIERVRNIKTVALHACNRLMFLWQNGSGKTSV